MEGLSSAPLMISPHVERPCVRKATRWQPWSLRVTYIGSLLDPAVIQRGNAVSWICLDHGGFEIDSSRRRDPLHAMGSFHASQSVGLARESDVDPGVWSYSVHLWWFLFFSYTDGRCFCWRCCEECSSKPTIVAPKLIRVAKNPADLQEALLALVLWSWVMVRETLGARICTIEREHIALFKVREHGRV